MLHTNIQYIDHYLGISFPSIPYIWHYDDFAMPFPVYKMQKVTLFDLKNVIRENINNCLVDELRGLSDYNTDVYIVAQYKNERFMYSDTTNSNELYLSYHTLLYNSYTKKNRIDDTNINLQFRYLTGIYTIEGHLSPYIYKCHKEKCQKIHNGIEINNGISLKQATIHKHNDIVKFSGINACNFNISYNDDNSDTIDDNVVFLSVMKKPFICQDTVRKYVRLINNKQNCIVLHIFRNVYDNNPNNEEYQDLINKYMN